MIIMNVINQKCVIIQIKMQAFVATLISKFVEMSCKTSNWTAKEDEKLKQIVESVRTAKWASVARKLNRFHFTSHKRTSSQCRQRWVNSLDPTINTAKWSNEEEQKLFDLHSQLGNSWTLISRKILGRPSIAVKNHFYAALRKGLRRLNKEIRRSYKQSILKPIPKRFVSKVLCIMSPKHKNPKFESIRSSCVELVSHILNFSRAVRGDQSGLTCLAQVVEVCRVLAPVMHQNSRAGIDFESQQNEEIAGENEPNQQSECEPTIIQKSEQSPKYEFPRLDNPGMYSNLQNFPHQPFTPWLPSLSTQLADQCQSEPSVNTNNPYPYPVINWMSGPITYFQNQYWFRLPQ